VVLVGCFWWCVNSVSCCVRFSGALLGFKYSLALSALVVPEISTIFSVVHLVIVIGSSGAQIYAKKSRLSCRLDYLVSK